MILCGGLRIERKIFKVNKIGEKKNKVGKQKKSQKNERNKQKRMLVWIRSNKFLKINKLQSHNVTHKVTRTCPYGTIICRNHQKYKIAYVLLDPVADSIFIAELNNRLCDAWKTLPGLNFKPTFQTQISKFKLEFQIQNLPCPPG